MGAITRGPTRWSERFGPPAAHPSTCSATCRPKRAWRRSRPLPWRTATSTDRKSGRVLFRSRAEEVVGAIRASGGASEYVLGDLSTEAGMEEVAAAALANGHVDILVHNAGEYAAQA